MADPEDTLAKEVVEEEMLVLDANSDAKSDSKSSNSRRSAATDVDKLKTTDTVGLRSSILRQAVRFPRSSACSAGIVSESLFWPP